MKTYQQQTFSGERPLYDTHDAKIQDCCFIDGESAIKECSELTIDSSFFEWKYPIWYSENLHVEHCQFFKDARAAFWYIRHSSLRNSTFMAPKGLRRCEEMEIENVHFSDGQETLWDCHGIKMKNICSKGDYFGMNSSDLEIENLSLESNYSFDGVRNVHVRNSKIIGRDAFWNSKDILIEDSTLSGAYFGWNSENVTLKNCVIESLQGFCYMKNVKLIHCRLLHTTLAFEYVSDLDAEIDSEIDSVKNPISGRIKCQRIKKLILEKEHIDPEKTEIIQTGESDS